MSSTIKKAPRHKYFASLAAFLGVLLGLGGVEVAARVLGLAPTLPNEFSFVPDSVLPWRLRPNKHNEMGFRGRNYEIKKEPGIFRIVGIGDSFTYGAGVSDDATYLARIEATLLERGGGGRTNQSGSASLLA